MTTLIVGLGNPGPEYAQTRHNFGSLTLDWLREHWDAPPFHSDSKLFSAVSSVVLDGRKVILAKPLTFMNESGQAVQALLRYFKLNLDSLIVIHDDLDLAPGTLRITHSSRAAGHNGVQDIITTLGSQDFHRIRLGIGRPIETQGVCLPAHDYVLGRFSATELTGFEPLFTAVEKSLRTHWTA